MQITEIPLEPATITVKTSIGAAVSIARERVARLEVGEAMSPALWEHEG